MPLEVAAAAAAAAIARTCERRSMLVHARTAMARSAHHQHRRPYHHKRVTRRVSQTIA